MGRPPPLSIRPHMDVLPLSTPEKNQPVPVDKTQLPQATQNLSPTGPNFSKLEHFQNGSQTSPEPVSADSELTQDRSRMGTNPIQVTSL